MKWLKRIGLVILLLALAVVPFLISIDDPIPMVERKVSTRLGEPVKFGSLRVDYTSTLAIARAT